MKDIFALLIWIGLAVITFTVTLTIIDFCRRLTTVAEEIVRENTRIVEAEPLWMRLEKAGIQNYTVDDKKGVIIIRVK
jgi:hypothetical protein